MTDDRFEELFTELLAAANPAAAYRFGGVRYAQRRVEEIREELRSALVDDLTFTQVSEVNLDRCREWHDPFGFGVQEDGWTGADWSNAMCGEAGEAANVVKKLRRIELKLRQAAYEHWDLDAAQRDLLYQLQQEIGDTFLYLDLLAQYYGLSVAESIVMTFNRVSAREGFSQQLKYLKEWEVEE